MTEIDEKTFIDALNHVAATDEGKIVLACLKEYCRFDGDILAENSTENTYANATLRRAYLYLRNRIRAEHLKKIEYDYKRKVENHGKSSTSTDPSPRPAGRTGKRKS
jgi:hypothetical protein